MIKMENLKLNLRAKVLLIPVSIITLTFLITAILLVKLTISNGYVTQVEGHNKQILTGLTLMATSQLPADAYLALEGYDNELAQDLMKQINSLGIYDIFITDLNGQLLFAKDETEKAEFNSEFGSEFSSMLSGSPKNKGYINTIYYSGHIVGYTPIVDVETSKGFLVFGVDITDELVETAVLALGGLDDREDAAGLTAGNESEHNLLREILIVLFSVMVPSFILILLLLGSTFRNIINPVNLLINAFKKLSNGDLTQEIEVKTNDEMNQLAAVFNMTIANLHDMVENVNNSSGSVAVSASQLSGASQEINKNAQNQTEKTAQSASAMEELNSSFEDVARNTANAADSAKKAAELAVNGGEIMTKTVSGMNQISETVNYSANTVEALGKRSEEIGAIIEVINDIAGQTNLLALNAAIEAARAGEQGRGFAVVADEVRKLAERTTSATNEIGEMITGIQDDTGKAVESMKAGTKEVEEGVNLANQAGEALKNIVTSVQNVTDMMQHVATAAEQQSTTGQEISSNIESVAEITKQTADAVMNSSEATTNLDNLAQELQQSVRGFNL